MNYSCTKHTLYQMIIIYMAYYTQHGTECYKKKHFKAHSLLHKLCHRALGCRWRWLWWCTVDTVDAAAATVAVDKLAPSSVAGSLGCLFSSNCTDGCTVLMCLCRLFVEPSTLHTLHSILLHFLLSLIFSPFQRIVSVASALSLSLFLSLSLCAVSVSTAPHAQCGHTDTTTHRVVDQSHAAWTHKKK